MPARKKIVVLMASWNQLYPARDAEARQVSRDLRLRFCARIVGRVLDSCDDLTDAELEKVIQQVQSELRAKGQHDGLRGSNVRRMPNRNVATREQVWKIRQLERYLGWTPAPKRLSGFLDQFFKKRRPEHLTHGQAYRAIESMFSVAARTALKAAHGEAYQVSKPELAAEVTRLKIVLQSWQPELQSNL